MSDDLSDDIGIDEERRRYVRRELARCEQAWKAGIKDAVSDAVALCSDFRCQIPHWLSQAVNDALAGKGLSDAKRQQDLVHYVRWDAVRELRDRKGEDGIPRSWEKCYAHASDILKGTKAEGAPETIRASYKRVAQEMRERLAQRYYLSHKKQG